MEGLSREIRGPEYTCSWWGDVGSVDTVSQLLSWNQALGLPRTVLVLDLAWQVWSSAGVAHTGGSPLLGLRTHLIIWEGLGGVCS